MFSDIKDQARHAGSETGGRIVFLPVAPNQQRNEFVGKADDQGLTEFDAYAMPP